MVRKANRSWLALPVLALVALPTSAQDLGKPGIADTATVTAVDPATGTLTVTSEGRTQHFKVDAQTQIQSGTADVPLIALQPGTRVAISANREGAAGASSPVAERVQVVQSPAQGAAAVETLPVSEARAELRDTKGASVGEARLRDTAAGVLVHVTLRNLPAGVHGFHVHQTGRCEGDFSSAGEHFAPDGRDHGFLVPGGPHAGDLVNVTVAADGKLEQELRAPELSLEQLLDQDGAALVVHAGADDYLSQPSGGAGDRIACGAIEPITGAPSR